MSNTVGFVASDIYSEKYFRERINERACTKILKIFLQTLVSTQYLWEKLELLDGSVIAHRIVLSGGLSGEPRIRRLTEEDFDHAVNYYALTVEREKRFPDDNPLTSSMLVFKRFPNQGKKKLGQFVVPDIDADPDACFAAHFIEEEKAILREDGWRETDTGLWIKKPQKSKAKQKVEQQKVVKVETRCSYVPKPVQACTANRQDPCKAHSQNHH